MDKFIYLVGIVIIMILLFGISLNNYIEFKKRYGVEFNDCLMTYSGDFCNSKNLHLNDINLLSNHITFICIDTETKEKFIFDFSEKTLNNCQQEKKR